MPASRMCCSKPPVLRGCHQEVSRSIRASCSALCGTCVLILSADCCPRPIMTVRILLSLFEFLLTIGLAVCVVYVNYRLVIRVNPDYDPEQELKNRNVSI